MNKNCNFNLFPTISLLSIALSFLFIAQSNVLLAQDNLLDPAFGIQGKQLSTGGKEENIPVLIRKLSDGKILFGAIARYGKLSKLTLTRLEPTGKVDSSFATDGILLSDNIPAYYYGQSIVLDSSENIYIGGGNYYSPFRITKHNRQGVPDLSFGNQGQVDVGTSYRNARAQIKLRNNNIYVLGNFNSKYGYPYSLQKFDLNGNKDHSFGQNGLITLTTNFVGPELEVTQDDKLLVTGGDYKIIIRKYLKDGSLDISFGKKGEVIYNDTTSRLEVENSFIMNDQSILISGRAVIPNSYKFLAKYSQDGILDTSFANSGFLRVTDSIAQYPFDLFVFSDDNEITTVHGERINTKELISIKKFTNDGVIKTNFANNGSLTLEYIGLSPDYGDAFQDPSGNILLANRLYTFSNPGYSQISFLYPDGSFNSTFGSHGFLDLIFGHSVVYSSQLLSLNNNEIIHGGTQYYGWGSNIQLNRFNSNGISDSTWSINGVSTIPRQRVFLYNRCGIVQPDGKILIGGHESYDSATDTPDQMYICRLLEDGSIDSSFAINGVSHIYDRYHQGSSVNAIALERNGDFIVGGYTTFSFPSLIRLDTNGTVKLKFERMKDISERLSNKILITKDDKIYNIGIGYNSKAKIYYSHITRFFPDGTLDLQFGVNATRLISTFSSDLIKSGILDQQERIILVGLDTIPGSDSSMFACRILTNGMIDTTFADKGFFRYKVNNLNSAFSDVLIDKKGRIYFGGTGYKTNSHDFILLCLDDDGKFIHSFGENGLVYADFDGGKDALTSMIFDSDENIILGGNSESTESYYMALAKVLNNLSVGTIDDASVSEMQYIYPNPVADHVTLKFSLNNAQHVSIHISDLKGNTISKLMSRHHFNQGEHQVELKIPTEIIAGYYFITIHSGSQSKNIKFLKF